MFSWDVRSHRRLYCTIIGVSRGAVLIEKHFKLNDKLKSVDQSFSLNPESFNKMVLETAKVKKILGSGKNNFSRSENKIVVLKDQFL